MTWPIGPGERVTNAIFLLPSITDAALARRLPAFSVLAPVVSRGCAAAFHALNDERFLCGEIFLTGDNGELLKNFCGRCYGADACVFCDCGPGPNGPIGCRVDGKCHPKR
jgi:hypothetical protein